MRKKKVYKEPKSLVIGFCACAKCGWTDGKFNWHTFFKCPQCGCNEFIKEDYNVPKGNENTERIGMDNHDDVNDIFPDYHFLSD